MCASERTVIDTNVFISATILARSVPRQAVNRALNDGIILLSEATLGELTETLFRSRFDDYVGVKQRELFLAKLAQAAEFVAIIRTVRECRDPNDDKILEVALNGRADAIITGDQDLLALSPWGGTAILRPAQYLSQQSDQEI
jgi:putative PIN family toxin of toxin-antitoxin system